MKQILYLLTFSLLLGGTSCSSDDAHKTTCNTDLTSNSQWLNTKVHELEESELSEYFYVERALYDGQTVFIIANCCPHCNTVMPMYNCDGQFVANWTTDMQLQNKLRIWQSQNSECPVEITHG